MSDAVFLPNRLVLADLVPGAWVRDVALVIAGAGLVGAAAQVSIVTPLSPVPFTLQTLAVLVVGASLGTVRAVVSLLAYVAAGLAGVPWFAGHASGWVGVSSGYLVGFVVAAAIVGALARRGADRQVLSTLLIMAAGTLVVDLVGTVWLAIDLHVGAVQAFDFGMRPFLVTDAIKVGLAALAFPAAWKLARRD